MDSKNMIIAVLSVTAVVLLCTVVLLNGSWRSLDTSLVWADTVDRGGDYILVTGAFSDNNEALYALDGSNDRLNVYQYDPNEKGIVLYHSVDLRNYFVIR